MIGLALLIPFLPGLTFVLWQSRPNHRRWYETVSLGFLTGQVFLAMVLSLTTLIQGTIQPVLISFLLLSLSCIFFLINRRHSPETSDRPQPNPSPDTCFKTYRSWLRIFLICLVFVVIFLAFVNTLSAPIIAYDGFAIYAPKAYSMYLDRNISSDFLLRDLPHPDYPLLIPVSEAWTGIFMGQWHERSIKLIFPLFITAAAFLLAGAINRRCGSPSGWLAAFLLLVTPGVFHSGTRALCDFPLGVFLLAGVIVLWEPAETKRTGSSILLPVILLAGASWTKNEGLPLACLILGVFTFIGHEKSQWKIKIKPYRTQIYRWVGLIALVIPWWIVKIRLNLTNEMITPETVQPGWWIEHFYRIPALIRYFASEMVYSSWQRFEWGDWLAGWVMFWIALFCWVVFHRRLESGILALITVFQLLLFLFVFMITPYELSYQLRTALDRMLLQIYPTALLFTTFLFFQFFPGDIEDNL